MAKRPLGKYLFVAGIVAVLLLNAYTFWVAYPETYTLTPGINADGDILAKDFSAYYMGAWRLWNNPTHIYTFGALGGNEPSILPHPEAYKYLPSFLLVVSPLLTLDYQQALWAFDIIQFALLPFMAYMLYCLLGKKGLAVTFVVIVIALLQPFPTPQWGASVSYYWQWGEGQAKVLETFLLLLSLYLGFRKKPLLSGVALAFGFFDPRFGLLALPMFVYYNWGALRKAFGSLGVMLVASNLMLLYPGLGGGFIGMVFGSGLMTPLYYYSLIPFFTMLALIVVNGKEFAEKIKPLNQTQP
jgi:hypothetical protein